MPINGLRAFSYEAFPIEKLDYFDIPVSRTGGRKTGGMSPKKFDELLENIRTNGLINPVIVEDDNTSLKVALGNNRIIAMKELGHDHIKALVITKNCNPAPAKGFVDIPPQYLECRMKKLHPGDDKWAQTRYCRQMRTSFRQQEEPTDP